jgi:hypothetical protein
MVGAEGREPHLPSNRLHYTIRRKLRPNDGVSAGWQHLRRRIGWHIGDSGVGVGIGIGVGVGVTSKLERRNQSSGALPLMQPPSSEKAPSAVMALLSVARASWTETRGLSTWRSRSRRGARVRSLSSIVSYTTSSPAARSKRSSGRGPARRGQRTTQLDLNAPRPCAARRHQADRGRRSAANAA